MTAASQIPARPSVGACPPLETKHVRLGVRVNHKEEAIRITGRLLVETGCIEPAYIESMLAREAQADTFLGHGIAIPHGRLLERDLILETGVVVVQVPQGVEWGQGRRATLIVGIAARSDDHLAYLAALTDILYDPSLALRLTNATEAEEIVAALSRRTRPAITAVEGPAAGALHFEVVLAGRAGLHARPATRLVEVARTFSSDIRVSASKCVANGKSLPALLKLGAKSGTVLRIEAAGVDAEAALAALRRAIETGLGDYEPIPLTHSVDEPVWIPPAGLRAIAGLPGSAGFAIGPLRSAAAEWVSVADQPSNLCQERSKLEMARATVRIQLQQLRDDLAERTDSGTASIIDAQRELLDDSEVLEEVLAQLALGHNAAWSWQQVVARRAEELRLLPDPRLAARAADWLDLGQRLLRAITGASPKRLGRPDSPAILLADDLAPSDVASLDPAAVLGLCFFAGGATGHAAILARSLGLPAVVGMGPLPSSVASGALGILDGTSGVLYLEPDATAIAHAEAFQRQWLQRRTREAEQRFRPAILSDGLRLEIGANIAAVAEVAKAVAAGAEGVGLLRTEFLFLNRTAAPSEDEQITAYRGMMRALGGLPLVIRSLDIGADKPVPYLPSPAETNPALGLRGLRLSLEHPELFRSQLRAVYRAATEGPVKLLFPMVASLEELRAAKSACEEVRRDLAAPQIEIGIMVEVPVVALQAAEFASEVDFFSIGTNDLTQYVLSIDRQHPSLGRKADALHPAVLRLIAQTVRAARAAGRGIGVCGGLASEPRGAMILAGLGVSGLSLSVPAIPSIKAALRGISGGQARALAEKALACATAEEVRALALPA